MIAPRLPVLSTKFFPKTDFSTTRAKKNPIFVTSNLD